MGILVRFVGLLAVSNTFMTIAWYGHLKHKNWPLWSAILISWLIASAEYVFQVPANRIGAEKFTLTQLKVMQECITLLVFGAYAWLVFREPPKWNTLVSMALIIAAVFFAFLGKSPPTKPETGTASITQAPSAAPNGSATMKRDGSDTKG